MKHSTKRQRGSAILAAPVHREPATTTEPAPRSGRSWKQKFGTACYGIKLGVRGDASFFVHGFFTALVIATAAVLQCHVWQWCVLVGCIGLVLTAELFNSALEVLFRGLDEKTRERAWPALDIAAGAVLMASMTAVVVGCLVFVTRLLECLEYVKLSL